MSAKKVPLPGMTTKEMTDLFGFLYFLRYMEELGDPTRGRSLLEAGACGKCHRVKEGQKEDLRRWGMYVNPILWAQMMWNHALPMEQEMRKKGIPRIQFKGRDMADLIAYIRSASEGVERVYLSPGDARSGEKLFGKKGCSLCHGAGGQLDLARKKQFPGTPAELAGAMWNHSHIMQKVAMEKGLPRPDLSSDEMTDLVAYLFSIRYFDGPGNPGFGKRVFTEKKCGHCHGKDAKKPDLSALKGRVSPIVMARTLWNHGPMMLELSRKGKLSWQKIDDKEMVNLMEYLNQGMP
jgi:mono/diheme cytochrome c family protein